MINFKEELENYPPVDLNKLLEASLGMPDNIRNSIVLYNKALENFRLKSEDIAIIELKKAISLNPDFHEAMNLLGVFYIYTGEYDKASYELQRVINAERNSVRALEYLKEIDPSYSPPTEKKSKSKETKNKVNKDDGSKGKSNSFSSNSTMKLSNKRKSNDIVKIGIAFAAGALLVFLLSFRAYFNENTVDAGGSSINSQDVLIQNEEDKEDYEAKYNELSEKYNGIKGQLEQVNKEVDYYINVSKLLEIDKLVSEKKYEAAADMLLIIKNIDFKGFEKQKFEVLFGDTMEKGASELYAAGRNLFKSKKYQEALEKFQKSATYDQKWKNSSTNLYYLGYCYKELNNEAMALKVFNEVIEKYPNTQNANHSKSRINEINR